MIRWALIDAVWNAPNGQACRGPAPAGLHRREVALHPVGRYPYAEQWRPALVVVLFIGMILASCDRRMWGRRLLLLWPAGWP